MAPTPNSDPQRLKALAVTLLSHELRTPLTTISTATEMLSITMTDPALEADRVEFMGIIKKGVKQLSGIVDELLLFSEIEQNLASGSLVRKIDLPAVVRNLILSLSPSIDAKKLTIDYVEMAVPLETEGGKLSEILLQLLSNAVKFSPNGAKVSLVTTVAHDDVEISIIDQGAGIAADDFETLFTPFHQAENPLRRHQGGLGLGLYLARRLAHSLGGEIKAESQPGQGATFTLVLPLRSPLADQNQELSERLAQLESEVQQAHQAMQQLNLQRHVQDEALDSLKELIWEQASRLQDFQRQAESRTALLERSFSDAVRGLSGALELRSPHLHGHLRRTAAYAVTLARELQWPETAITQLGIAALLHDAGAIGLPDQLIHPQARPSGAELLHLQSHVDTGADLIAQVTTLGEVAAIVRAHHERWDGQGYPRKLSGEAIPPAARILAVADALDNALCDFPYREGAGLAETIDRLKAGAGTLYDPQVIAAFDQLAAAGIWQSILGQYPALGVLDDR